MTSSSSSIAEQVFGLYRTYGTSDYIGEPVTQLSHALQAAEQAEQEGFNDEIILGAFFHDIGHLVGEHLGIPKMVTKGITLGVQSHDQEGKAFLNRCGVKGTIADFVGMHVQAKRYLVAKVDGYYNQLSEASKMTLEHQGGPMNRSEIQMFESNPLKNEIIRMRQWDEKAKDSSKYTDKNSADEALCQMQQRFEKYLMAAKNSDRLL